MGGKQIARSDAQMSKTKSCSARKKSCVDRDAKLRTSSVSVDTMITTIGVMMIAVVRAISVMMISVMGIRGIRCRFKDRDRVLLD